MFTGQVFENQDTTEFAKQFADITLKIQKIYQLCLQPNLPDEFNEQLNYFVRSYQDIAQKVKLDPNKLSQLYTQYSQEYLSLMQKAATNWQVQNNQGDTKSDNRFKDTAWQDNPLFHFIQDYYLLTAKHIKQSVADLEGLDEKTATRLQFYTQQFLDAFSPSNFAMTNPQVLKNILSSSGKNLIEGLNNFIADLERNGGKLQINMTDLTAFKLGENIATTPGKVIFQNDLMQLIQYSPQTEQVYQRPLLIIPPWINKYYILDLNPEISLVNWLVQQGYTVFMISWVNPDQSHAEKNFENYLSEGSLAAIDVVKKVTGEEQINVVGYCIGGTLLGSTLAYLEAHQDHSVHAATYLATLLDFSEPGLLGVYIDEDQITLLEEKMKKAGYLDGRVLFHIFNSLRANDLIWSYYVKNYLLGEKLIPLDILYWNSDPTNMPEKMHSFYLRNMYLNNRLKEPNGITLLDTPIDLRKIKIPAYFLSAEQDHIALWQATYRGAQLHSGPVTFVLGGSGHIAGIVNSPQKNKYYHYTQTQNLTDFENYLSSAEKSSGSWWPHWEKWLREKSGNQISARQVGSHEFSAIEDAPGSYVKVKIN